MSDTPDSAAAVPSKKKGKSALFLILGIVVLLAGAGVGAGAYFMFTPKPEAAKSKAAGAKDAPKEDRKEEKARANGLISFEPFVVNLADPGGRRFLRINVRLLVPEEEEAKHVEESQVVLMQLRAAILELLTAQTSEQIASIDGKSALKTSIIEHTRPILEPTEVSDVLFSDFVVQY